MFYYSTDIETTGINPEYNQVLEVGIIREDTNNPKPKEECPQFRMVISHQYYNGSAFAINMNARLFNEIVEGKNITPVEEAAQKIFDWLSQFEDIKKDKNERLIVTAAGKNFSSFDKRFLMNLPNFNNLISFGHRSLDPSLLYIDWKEDTEIPGLAKCKKRRGIDGIVTHNAVDDAWDVIELLRPLYSKVDNFSFSLAS